MEFLCAAGLRLLMPSGNRSYLPKVPRLISAFEVVPGTEVTSEIDGDSEGDLGFPLVRYGLIGTSQEQGLGPIALTGCVLCSARTQQPPSS